MKPLRASLSAILVCIAALSMTPARAQQDNGIAILAFGDSLTAGYGLEQGQAFPDRLEAALRAKGLAVRLVNAGVSGDTTGGGRQRLEWVLGPEIDAVILELGANDALRGLAPRQARENLAAMLETLQERNLPVLLAGMRAPPNLGRAYVAAFDAIYPELAQEYGVPLYPFFLEGVALRPHLNLPDGLHPNAAGVERIVANILPDVERLVAAAQAGQRP